jgi:multicomponent Na+:H+ antiporter subunit B
MLAAISRVGRVERARSHPRPGLSTPGLTRAGALLACALTAGALLYGAADMPAVGDPEAPAHVHPEVARHYLEESPDEIGPPNVVTSVLGDYRGYDTWGETVVIFTAALCVVLLLRQAQSSGREERHPEPTEDDERGGAS